MLAETAAHNTIAFPILTVLVLLPAIGAAIVALLPKQRDDLVKLVGLLSAVFTGALTLWLLGAFASGEAGYQFVSKHSWIERWGISWHLGVDGVSLFLVVLTGILFPIALLGSKAHHDQKSYTAWILLLEAGVLGSFLSLDLFLFFVFFEIVLVPMYFLIGGWGYDKRVYASLKFFIYTMAGSALMLVAIIATVFLSARNGDGRVTFDLLELVERGGILGNTGRWLFLGLTLAFAVKTPLVPFHTWLPDAHTQAPTAGSVILAGVLLKMGTYGILRFSFMLFPEAARYFRPLMLTLAVVGILYGAIVATMQRDLKRLVAYSSVAHMGFIVLGAFAFTIQSMTGGVLQMINHGVSTGALFLMVGMISDRRHTREISALKGLQSVAPVFAGVFTLVMLSSIGVPGLNGFVGEFLILIGSFGTARWWTVVAATGVIFAALYLLWAYQRVFHGEPDEENKHFAELRWTEGLVLAPLLGLIVFTGVFPKPLTDRIQPSVCVIIDHVYPEGSQTPEEKAESEELSADSANAADVAAADGTEGCKHGQPTKLEPGEIVTHSEEGTTEEEGE